MKTYGQSDMHRLLRVANKLLHTETRVSPEVVLGFGRSFGITKKASFMGDKKDPAIECRHEGCFGVIYRRGLCRRHYLPAWAEALR